MQNKRRRILVCTFGYVVLVQEEEEEEDEEESKRTTALSDVTVTTDNINTRTLFIFYTTYLDNSLLSKPRIKEYSLL